MRNKLLIELMQKSYSSSSKKTKNRTVAHIINEMNDREQVLFIEYLLQDMSHASYQELNVKHDFPDCLHMLPLIMTVDEQSPLQLFLFNDQMDNDLTQSLIDNKPLYLADPLAIDILGYHDEHSFKNHLLSQLIDVSHLSENILRIFKHPTITNANATNILNISESKNHNSIFCDLLKELFDANQEISSVNKHRIEWNHSSSNMSEEWIIHIWQYLNTQQIPFHNWSNIPIVIASDIKHVHHCLCMPDTLSWILIPYQMQNNNENKTDDDDEHNSTHELVFELLIEYGKCVILDDAIDDISRKQLMNNKCLFEMKVDSILDLLSKLPKSIFKEWKNNSSKLHSHLNALRTFLIQDKKWNSNVRLSRNMQSLLKSLPIYEVYDDDDGHMNTIITDLASDIKYIPPLNTNPRLLNSEFIHLSSEEIHAGYETFLKLLNIQQLNINVFYNKYFFSNLNKFKDDELRDQTMIQILKIIKSNLLKSSSKTNNSTISDLIQMTKDNACIPTENRSLKRISQLYDPTIKSFQSILDPNKHFPSKIFSQSSNILSILKELGLNVTLTRDAIILAVTSISNSALMVSDQALGLSALDIEYDNNGIQISSTESKSKLDETEMDDELHRITKRAQSLLTYLDRNALHLFTNNELKRNEWKPLQNCPWLPIFQPIELKKLGISMDTHFELPFKDTITVHHRFATCKEVKTIHLASVCSSQYFLLNFNIQNALLKQELGIECMPDSPIIAKQLVSIANAFDKLEPLSKERLSFQEWLTSHVPILYRTITQQLFAPVIMLRNEVNNDNNNQKSNSQS